MNMQDFLRTSPSGINEYSAYNDGIQFTITGITEQKVRFASIAGAPDLESYIQEQMDELYRRLTENDVVPVDTGLYKSTIDIQHGNFIAEVSIGNEAQNSKGESYAKYLIFGASTFRNAALYGRKKDDKKWKTAKVVGGMGILHDVQLITGAWEVEFFEGLNTIQFAQPHDVRGRFMSKPF